jgi:hypothetical protein
MQSFVVEVSHQLEAINTPQFILYTVQTENVFSNVLREKCLSEKIRFNLSFLCMYRDTLYSTVQYSSSLVSSKHNRTINGASLYMSGCYVSVHWLASYGSKYSLKNTYLTVNTLSCADLYTVKNVFWVILKAMFECVLKVYL